MFEKLRFKKYYTRFKKEHHKLDTGWAVSLRDTALMAKRLPVKVIAKFGQEEIRYTHQFTTQVYHANVIELLENCRAATLAMTNDDYIESDPGAPTSVRLDEWLQPTNLACNFQLLLQDLDVTFGEFIHAYENVQESKTGYYSRKTFHITHDMFSLIELLSELVLWDRS